MVFSSLLGLLYLAADPTFSAVDKDNNSELAYYEAKNDDLDSDESISENDQNESDYPEESDKGSNILNLFSFGITSSYELSNLYGVEYSETESPKLVQEDFVSRSNFNVCFELNTPVLTLAYQIQNNKIGERDFDMRYSSYALDLRNIGITYDIEAFSASLILPKFTYSTGDSRDFSFRGLNMQIGPLEMTNEHKVFWDKNDPSMSFTHSTARYTIIGLEGLMERMADYTFYSDMNDARGSFVYNAASESVNLPVLPYCNLLFQEDKFTTRRLDKILNENKTGYKFGWDFGASLIYNMCYQTSFSNLAAVLKASVGYKNFTTEVDTGNGLYFELSIKAGLFFKNNKY